MADDILNVDGLAWKTKEQKLRDYFEQYGEISNVIIDRNTPGGRSRTANFSGYIIFNNPADINNVPRNHIIDGRNVVTVGGQRLHAQVEIDGGNPQGAEEERNVEEPVQELPRMIPAEENQVQIDGENSGGTEEEQKVEKSVPCMKSEETQVETDRGKSGCTEEEHKTEKSVQGLLISEETRVGGNSGGIEEEHKVEKSVQELPCMKSEETQVETDGGKSGCTEEEHKAEKSVQGLLISEETRVGGNSGGIEEEHKVEESVQELPCMISKETQVEIDGAKSGCNEERKAEKSVKGLLISEETQVETDGGNSDWIEEEHKVEKSVQELPCMVSEETQFQIDGGNSGCTEEEHKAEKSGVLSEETRVGGNSGSTEEEHKVEKSGQGLPCMVSKEIKQAESARPLPPWRIWMQKEESCFKPRKDDILNIDGLAWKTTEQKLRDYFEQYGEISNVIINRNTPGGRSRTANFSGYIIFNNPADINNVPRNHIIDGRNVVTVGGQRLHAQVEIDGGNPQGIEEERKVEEPVQELPCMIPEENQVQVDGGNSGGTEEEHKVEKSVPCMKSEETQVETDGGKSGCTEEEHKAEKSVQGLLISEETRVGGNSGGIEEEHKVDESVQELPCIISKETQVEIDGGKSGCNEERKAEKSVKGLLISEETQVETDGGNSDWTEEEHKVEKSVQELPCMVSEETQVQIDGGNSGCTEEEHKAEKYGVLSEETRVGENSGWTEEEHKVEKSGQGLPCMVSKETKQAESARPLPPWRIWMQKEETCFKPRKKYSPDPDKQAENVERARAAFARATERDNEIEDDDYDVIRVVPRDYLLPVDKSLLEKLENLDDNKPLLKRLKDWNDEPLLKQLNMTYDELDEEKWD